MIYAKSYIDKDIKEEHLAKDQYSNTLFFNCDGRYLDLRGKDLTSSSFPKTDLSHAKFLNAKISLNCHTFEDMKLDRMSACMYLYLLTLADIPEQLKNSLIYDTITVDVYNKLKEFFSKTEST